MATSASIHGLYVIIDPDACGNRSPIDVARRALEGGARVLQWRDKRRDKGDQLSEARAIAELCNAHYALLIINDHADLVAASGAHGVHLGQHDLPIAAARAVLGPAAIIGVSTNNADEAAAAEAAGANYVAVGAIFPTRSKGDTRTACVDRIREVKAAVGVPVVAIGGINTTNIADVVAAGADAAAVISAVCAAADVRAAAAVLATAFDLRQSPTRRDRLQAVIYKYVNTLNSRDRDAFLALFRPDGIIQDPIDQPPYIGRVGIAAWWDALMSDAGDYRVQLEAAHITGDEAAIVWATSYRHEGDERVERGIEILSFDGDLIASCHSYWSRSAAATGQYRALVAEYARAVQERDRRAFLGLFAAEAVQQDPVGTPPRIGHGMIGAWFDAMMDAFTNYDFAIDRFVVAGNEIAATWHVAYDVEGVRMEGAGVDIIGVDDVRKIASVHSYWEADASPFVDARQPRTDTGLEGKRLETLARQFIEVLNARDKTAFIALFAEDCVAQVPYHDAPFIGIDALAAWWDHAMPHSRHDLRLDKTHVSRDEIAIVWTDLDQSPSTGTAPRGIEVLTADVGRLSAVTSYRPLREVDDQRLVLVAEAYIAAVNARDRDAYLALWSEHGMRQDPPDMVPVIGISAIGQAFDQMLVRFPSHSVTVETICIAGNEAAIATHVESRDRTTPPFDGVIVIALDNDGKIAGLHGYWEA